MKKPLLPLFLFFLVAGPAFGQWDTVYSADYLRRSASFAWTTFGGDVLALTGGRASLPSGATPALGPSASPRLTIGGIHFWGHADFYVTFPLPLTLRSTPAAFSRLDLRHGIETGARVYPFPVRPGRASPFLGVSFRQFTYGHETAGADFEQGFPRHQEFVAPLQAGLTYATRKHLFTIGAQYVPPVAFTYASAPGQFGTTRLDPWSFTLSFLRYVDVDRSLGRPEQVAQENIKYHLLERHRRLSTWYLGAGPSAGLPLSQSSYIEEEYPHLAGDRPGGFMPDLTAGRYFGRGDFNVGLSYRTMGGRMRGFSDELRLRRHSIMVEGYKFLFNYHGFVPFLGATFSREFLRLRDDSGRYRDASFAVGLIAGWDIRVTRTGTNLLRTNLRWIPGLHLEVDGRRVMFNHLEFNFIQYVHFFGRGAVYRRYRAEKS